MRTCNFTKRNIVSLDRISPSGGWDWGDPPHYPKMAPPPCPPPSHCFDQKCQFCHFHAVFGHFAQIVPPPVDLIWEILLEGENVNFKVQLNENPNQRALFNRKYFVRLSCHFITLHCFLIFNEDLNWPNFG